jgi:hypothetical protein
MIFEPIHNRMPVILDEAGAGLNEFARAQWQSGWALTRKIPRFAKSFWRHRFHKPVVE